MSVRVSATGFGATMASRTYIRCETPLKIFGRKYALYHKEGVLGGWKKPKHLGAVVKQFPDTAQGKANAAYFANERTGLEQHTIVVPTLTMVGSLELFDIVEVPRIVLIEPKTEPALK